MSSGASAIRLFDFIRMGCLENVCFIGFSCGNECLLFKWVLGVGLKIKSIHFGLPCRKSRLLDVPRDEPLLNLVIFGN